MVNVSKEIVTTEKAHIYGAMEINILENFMMDLKVEEGYIIMLMEVYMKESSH